MISKLMRSLSGALACALVAACSTSQPAPSSTPVPEELNYSRQMPAIATGDLSGRGTVVSSSDQVPFDFSELPAGSTAQTMVYRSISGVTGSPTVVSGAVFTPPGIPPPGGWPVIGYAHGTVGVTPDCGPTVDSRLLGDITSVAIQLNLGYAVAYTDYAGLGKPAGSAPGRGDNTCLPGAEVGRVQPHRCGAGRPHGGAAAVVALGGIGIVAGRRDRLGGRRIFFGVRAGHRSARRRGAGSHPGHVWTGAAGRNVDADRRPDVSCTRV